MPCQQGSAVAPGHAAQEPGSSRVRLQHGLAGAPRPPSPTPAVLLCPLPAGSCGWAQTLVWKDASELSAALRGAQNHHNRVGPYHFRVRRAGGSGAWLAAPGGRGKCGDGRGQGGAGLCSSQLSSKDTFHRRERAVALQWMNSGDLTLTSETSLK